MQKKKSFELVIKLIKESQSRSKYYTVGIHGSCVLRSGTTRGYLMNIVRLFFIADVQQHHVFSSEF